MSDWCQLTILPVSIIIIILMTKRKERNLSERKNGATQEVAPKSMNRFTRHNYSQYYYITSILNLYKQWGNTFPFKVWRVLVDGLTWRDRRAYFVFRKRFEYNVATNTQFFLIEIKPAHFLLGNRKHRKTLVLSSKT